MALPLTTIATTIAFVGLGAAFFPHLIGMKPCRLTRLIGGIAAGSAGFQVGAGLDGIAVGLLFRIALVAVPILLAVALPRFYNDF